MKRAIVVAAALIALGFVSLAHAEEVGVSLDLDEIDGSGITGSAEIGSDTDDLSTTTVMVDMGGLEPDGTHQNHIHEGTGCAEGDYGEVVISLEPLEADGDGSATATTTVTETDAGDPVSFDQIANGEHVLIVHDAEGAPAACEAIPAAELEAGATATTAPESTPAATVEAPPSAGSGPVDGGSNWTAAWFAIAAAAALGIGAAAFGVLRIRR